MIGYLSARAYRDGKAQYSSNRSKGFLELICFFVTADTLDRFEVPYFGAWANSFVDEEDR